MARKSITLEDKDIILRRLQRKTVVDPITGCFLWKGSNNGTGYGEIRIGITKFYTHRMSAYIHFNYNLFGETQINHKPICPNRNCWNPDHIYEGTQFENIQDSLIAGTFMGGISNTLKTHCPYGHKYTKENTYIYENERHCKICRESRK